jgi:hypothetical protein
MQNQRHQCFGDIAPAELAEMAAFIGLRAEGVRFQCKCHVNFPRQAPSHRSSDQRGRTLTLDERALWDGRQKITTVRRKCNMHDSAIAQIS